MYSYLRYICIKYVFVVYLAQLPGATRWHVEFLIAELTTGSCFGSSSILPTFCFLQYNTESNLTWPVRVRDVDRWVFATHSLSLLSTLKKTKERFWHSANMRTFEQRTNVRGMRQILNLGDILKSCWLASIFDKDAYAATYRLNQVNTVRLRDFAFYCVPAELALM